MFPASWGLGEGGLRPPPCSPSLGCWAFPRLRQSEIVARLPGPVSRAAPARPCSALRPVSPPGRPPGWLGWGRSGLLLVARLPPGHSGCKQRCGIACPWAHGGCPGGGWAGWVPPWLLAPVGDSRVKHLAWCPRMCSPPLPWPAAAETGASHRDKHQLLLNRSGWEAEQPDGLSLFTALGLGLCLGPHLSDRCPLPGPGEDCANRESRQGAAAHSYNFMIYLVLPGVQGPGLDELSRSLPVLRFHPMGAPTRLSRQGSGVCFTHSFVTLPAVLGVPLSWWGEIGAHAGKGTCPQIRVIWG
ncbi:unnamed protein product [Lepidochelys olivacea]